MCDGYAHVFLVNYYYLCFYALFLSRQRKRAKKNGAARRGAGFSVNHLSGTDGNWVSYEHLRRTNASLLEGFARKNPPLHRVAEGNT